MYALTPFFRSFSEKWLVGQPQRIPNLCDQREQINWSMRLRLLFGHGLYSWVKTYINLFGDNSEEDTPVPIPNTEVKLFSADDTWRVTARKSRTSPDKKVWGQRPRTIGCSEVAQWWSNRLLTGRSWVRAPPSEPYMLPKWRNWQTHRT